MKWIEKNDMEFDMIGIDPAIANAFRRILIAEVKFFCVPIIYGHGVIFGFEYFVAFISGVS